MTCGKAVNRPALPGNRPLSEVDPTMHDLVQQESEQYEHCCGVRKMVVSCCFHLNGVNVLHS